MYLSVLRYFLKLPAESAACVYTQGIQGDSGVPIVGVLKEVCNRKRNKVFFPAYIYRCIYIYIYTYVCGHVNLYIDLCIHIWACIQICIDMYVCMCVCSHTHTHSHTNAHTHTHTLTHAHTHTHTHKLSRSLSLTLTCITPTIHLLPVQIDGPLFDTGVFCGTPAAAAWVWRHFCETYFTSHPRFVPNKSAISPRLPDT